MGEREISHTPTLPFSLCAGVGLPTVPPTGRYDLAALWWQGERLHRAVIFLTLMHREPTDYVEVSRRLYEGQTIDDIFARAKEHWQG
jgi:hypothetical protein